MKLHLFQICPGFGVEECSKTFPLDWEDLIRSTALYKRWSGMRPPGFNISLNPLDGADVYMLDSGNSFGTEAFVEVLLNAVLTVVGKWGVHDARRHVHISIRACKVATPKIRTIYQLSASI